MPELGGTKIICFGPSTSFKGKLFHAVEHIWCEQHLLLIQLASLISVESMLAMLCGVCSGHGIDLWQGLLEHLHD